MHFIDEAKIYLKSGDGGAGCTSFRREANMPKGGPNGGDGGRGGHIIIRAVHGLNTLIDYRYQQHFKASNGEHGKGSDRSGKNADDVVLNIPIGTQVFAEDGLTLIADVTLPDFEQILLKGGDGGFGNMHYKSSTNRSPRKSTEGWPGEELWIWLKLKLMSDVGLVGLPNAGKSTFISRVTRANAKIADYPFTTLKPQLGVAYVDEKEFVISDIPGLIEGASEGKGLGHRFLKHVERCRVILHILDGTDDNFIDNYKTIRNELLQYSEILAEKQEIVVINKCDALVPDEIEIKKQWFFEETGLMPMTMSAATGVETHLVLRELLKVVEREKKANPYDYELVANLAKNQEQIDKEQADANAASEDAPAETKKEEAEDL